MPVQLYYFPMSAPCRAVLLTAEAIGLEMELIEVNIMAGENLTPEYEELNPQKTIPFLVDDDLKLSESRAIMTYLVDQYGQDDWLYPQAPEERAVINQQLYFDLGTLYTNIFGYYMPVFNKITDTYDPEVFEKMAEAFQTLDRILEEEEYTAGRNLTLADLALVTSVTTAEAFGFNVEEYANVSAWLDRMKSSAPGYEKAIGEPIEILKKFVEEAQGEKGEEEEEEEEEAAADGEEEKEEGEKEENEDE